jgi:3-methyl-2-oxobutanoate hydroxymethyltransferase
VSITTGDFRQKITPVSLLEKKQKHEPITCLTAYDYVSARLVDEAGIDMVLVGDSLGMVMLGYENTLPVTVPEMLHHMRAVRRGVKHAFLVADMPYASYHVGVRDTLRNAVRFIKDGAEAVKIEGGEKRARLVERLVYAEIPVMGHIGLTPQSLHAMGGYKVQGKTLKAIEQLMHDAMALESAGACCIVLEGIPREAAGMITHELEIPTIGIGAGPECDGQVLVFHDLLGLTFAPPAKFVRRYVDLGKVVTEAVISFKDDVKAGGYPSDGESYHLPKDTQASLHAIAEHKRALQI